MTALRPGGRPRLLPALWLLLALLLSGCATHGETFSRIEGRLAAGDPERALSELEALRASNRDRALYLLNRGMLLRVAGDLEGSIAAFEEAKRLGLDLEAISVSENVGALAVAEGVRAYNPDVFERILLHVYQALNFLEAGDLDAARVEALQIDLALRRLDPKDGRAPHGGDAFARYLSGIIFEAGGEWSDAMIAYRKAAEAYDADKQPLPRGMQHSMLWLTEHLELADEHASWRERFGVETVRPPAAVAGEAEVVVVLHGGLLPRKYETSVVAQDFRSGQLYRVSLPALQRRPPRTSGLEVVAEAAEARGEQVEAVHLAARRTLDQQLPGLTARAVARNVVRHNATAKARDENPLLGLVMNVAGFIADQADTRSWRTLPDTIQLARLRLPPGEHELTVILRDPAGVVVARHEYAALTLEAGDLRVISLHQVR